MLHALVMSVLRLILTRGKMSIQKVIKLVLRFNDDSDIIIIMCQAPVTRTPPNNGSAPVSLLLPRYFELYPYKTCTFTVNQNATINLLKRSSERVLIFRGNNVPFRNKT